MPTVLDMMNREVQIPDFPKRIVSLVPSQTELLFDLGLANRVVGITKFCIHPNEWYRSKIRIGGTKQVNFDRIKALQPDLIIGNKEENNRVDIEQLEQEFPVWMSDIFTVKDAFEMMLHLGKMTQTSVQADRIVKQVKDLILELPTTAPEKVLYLIWNNPIMVAGHNTFIDHIINLIGWKNACLMERYPEVTIADIHQLQPTRILLSSEPFPFRDKHVKAFKKSFPFASVEIVDGEYFSWYGSRMIAAFEAFKTKRY